MQILDTDLMNFLLFIDPIGITGGSAFVVQSETVNGIFLKSTQSQFLSLYLSLFKHFFVDVEFLR